MKGGAKKGWRWRTGDREASQRLNLLYEPGNWGDILKGIWAVETTVAIARKRAPFRYVDPFAGAPTYPLVDASRERLEKAPDGPFARIQRSFAARGTMASTGMLVHEAAGAAGASLEVGIFDLDRSRIEEWRRLEGFRALDVSSGDEAVAQVGHVDPAPDLVLVDPYDFFVRWQTLLPPALVASRRSTVLLYSYNKAPRGPGQQRMYEDFLEALRRGVRGREPAVLGRVPADASVARAWHEVVLLGPGATDASLRETLARATRELARNIVEGGAFEVIT